jgi:CBS domain-containing protein
MVMVAADVMTTPVISVRSHTGVGEIASLLSKKSISAVPVVNEDGSVAGMVSEGDILRPFTESARLKRDWWLGLIAAGQELSQTFLDYVRFDTRTAAELMVRRVITAGERATLPEVAELMVKNGVKRIPIVRDGKLVGIVSRADLIGAIARAPAMLV